MNGLTERRMPISHTAISRCHKNVINYNYLGLILIHLGPSQTLWKIYLRGV